MNPQTVRKAFVIAAAAGTLPLSMQQRVGVGLPVSNLQKGIFSVDAPKSGRLLRSS